MIMLLTLRAGRPSSIGLHQHPRATSALKDRCACLGTAAILSCRLQTRELGLRANVADACATLPRVEAALAQATASLTASTHIAEGLREELPRLCVSLGMLAGQGRPPPHRMLHQCFAIRCPDSFDLGLLRALDTILGESFANFPVQCWCLASSACRFQVFCPMHPNAAQLQNPKGYLQVLEALACQPI